MHKSVWSKRGHTSSRTIAGGLASLFSARSSFSILSFWSVGSILSFGSVLTKHRQRRLDPVHR